MPGGLINICLSIYQMVEVNDNLLICKHSRLLVLITYCTWLLDLSIRAGHYMSARLGVSATTSESHARRSLCPWVSLLFLLATFVVTVRTAGIFLHPFSGYLFTSQELRTDQTKLLLWNMSLCSATNVSTNTQDFFENFKDGAQKVG